MSNAIRGPVIMINATALIALSTLCAKMLITGEAPLSPFQITWGRYVFGLMALLIVLAIRRPKFTKPNWPLHAIRVGCGWGGVTAMFATTAFIPLSDTTAISFTNPIFAMLLAIPILKERIGPPRWISAGIALVGALLLIRPATSSFQPAALLALLAAMLFGLEVVMIKMLSRRESVFQLIIVVNIAGAILSSLVVVWVWQAPSLRQWILMAATGLAMTSAQWFFTHALKQGEASYIVTFSYAALLFATLYDFVFFAVVPVPLSIVGGAIIIISGIVLAWREGRANRLAAKG